MHKPAGTMAIQRFAIAFSGQIGYHDEHTGALAIQHPEDGGAAWIIMVHSMTFYQICFRRS